MKTLPLYRAQGIVGRDEIHPVTIQIAEELPRDAGYATFASEAAALAEALWASLPGGTVDALLVALMTKRASLLQVPFARPDELPRATS